MCEHHRGKYLHEPMDVQSLVAVILIHVLDAGDIAGRSSILWSDGNAVTTLNLKLTTEIL